jgi:hypothetical protein
VAACAVLFATRTARGDEIIEDPELAAVPHEATVAPPPKDGPRDAIWRVNLHTRWGVDTDWTRSSQDIVEGTSIAAVEVEQRRSDSLLLSAGLRARYAVGVHQDGAARYELDLAPLSLFADVTPGAGFHVRAGYQTVTMGRFDFFSPTNFLAVYDLRSGPVTMPEASAVATPALRFDMDHFRGFTLQAFYLPFFQPHIVTGYGTDYALFSVFDRTGALGTDQGRQVFERVLGRSGVTTVSTSLLQAFGPAPDLRNPQGSLRATLYGSAGELSATVGTALEPLPTVTFSSAFQTFLRNPLLGLQDTDALLDHPIRVEYPRYAVASLDGALDAGPWQLGAEAAYMFGRTLLGTSPTQLGIAERVGVAQFGLRAELVESAGWAAEIETFFAMASRRPTDPSLRWFGFDDRYQYGVAAGAHWSPEKSHWRFEFGGAAMAVATIVLAPRIEWEAVNTLFFELGGVFVQGSHPGVLGSYNMSFGGFFTDVDQVFLGVRWSP